MRPITQASDLNKHHLILVNSIFGLDFPRSLIPTIQMTGILHQSLEIDPSDQALVAIQAWIERYQRPVIYISYPDAISPSQSVLQLLLHGLAAAPCQVLWNLHNSQIEPFHSHIPASHYVIFQDMDDAILIQRFAFRFILTAGHSRILMTSLLYGTPILGVPYDSEQVRIYRLSFLDRSCSLSRSSS